MTTITIPKEKIKSLIKEGVQEVLTQELMKFRALLLPFVSAKEQKDIEKQYGKPSRKIAKTLEIKL